MDTKQEIRERLWNSLVKQKVAPFPGAAGEYLIGAEKCAEMLSDLK